MNLFFVVDAGAERRKGWVGGSARGVFDRRGAQVYIVMELVTGGELFDRIVEKDHYNESEAGFPLLSLPTCCATSSHSRHAGPVA